MVEIAEAASLVGPAAPTRRARERRYFGVFFTVLVVVQAAWLTGIALGIYALVT